MKNLLLSFILISTILSCTNREYKYKIQGQVRIKTKDNKDSLHAAIAYTDTIHGYNDDSIWYFNSDGSKLTLISPYTVSEIK